MDYTGQLPDNTDDAIRVLTNSGNFYQSWEKAQIEGVDDAFKRKCIADFYYGMTHKGLFDSERSKVRLHFERVWPIEHFLPQEYNNQPTPTEKETNMNYQTVTIKHTTTINGTDVSEMKQDDLIAYLTKCEDDLERLGKVKTESKAVQAKMKSIQDTIIEIVTLLDK